MMTRERFLKLAAVVAALAIIFLPKEVFLILWKEVVWLVVFFNVALMASGWEDFATRVSILIPHTGAILKFLVINRILSSISLFVDALMIYVGIKWGIVSMFLVGTAVFFFACMMVIWLYGISMKKGYDFLLINEVRELRNLDEFGEKIDKFTKWIMKSNGLLFWIGSLWIESDIITLIMRKKDYISVEETLKITLPSVVWCIGFWSIIFYLGILGYEFFDQFISIFSVVFYFTVLGYEYYKWLRQ